MLIGALPADLALDLGQPEGGTADRPSRPRAPRFLVPRPCAGSEGRCSARVRREHLAVSDEGRTQAQHRARRLDSRCDGACVAGSNRNAPEASLPRPFHRPLTGSARIPCRAEPIGSRRDPIRGLEDAALLCPRSGWSSASLAERGRSWTSPCPSSGTTSAAGRVAVLTTAQSSPRTRSRHGRARSSPAVGQLEQFAIGMRDQ